jgi:hypothetical protein
VHGIGQLAYWNGPNGPIQILTVWDRGYTLNLFAPGLTPLTTEKALAAQMLKHL